MRRRVTFSRNLTLSLSRTCQCYCKYCAFATHQAHLHEPDEVIELLDGAARRQVKELLVLTGERPEVNPEVAERLRAFGHEDFTAYVVWACERALERGLLPHTNLGVLSRQRPGAAARGDGVAGADARVGQPRPRGAPGLARPSTPPRGWRRSAPPASCASPSPAASSWASGRSPEERVAALQALAEVHGEYGHLQEVILQNFVPHRRYHGEEPADIAAGAADDYWRTGLNAPPELEPPEWATPIDIDEMRRLVREARRLLPGVGVQIPPNLADWWPELVGEGATDLGGLSANGDHISPEHPFPSPHQVRKRLAADGVALTERLCVYPQYIGEEWMAQGVLDVVKRSYWSFIPRRGSGRQEPPFAIRSDLVGPAVERAREGEWLSREELTALFAETRPRRSRTCAPPPTSCARSSRGTR